MQTKLYYSPGACSMASHIALEEAKADYQLEKVDLKTHRTATQNFYDINPKGSVPVLDIGMSGERLTENTAILPFIADKYPHANLIAPAGTMKRYHTMEWLGFIASEIHKAFLPYFHPDATSETKSEAERSLKKKFEIVDEALRRNTYLTGSTCTVADFYLFVMETWMEKFKHPSVKLSSVQRHLHLMREREAVKSVLKQYGH
jgi:glutathione S-transferase